MSFYIQMYTLRDETAKDFVGSLERVAKLGYSGVEFAGYGDIPAAEMAAKLRELGLTVPSSHVGIQRLEENLQGEIDYLTAVGGKYMVLPYARLETKQDVLDVAKKCNQFASACKAAGLKFAYHNHGHEFNKIDGQYILDILLENVPDMVLELDLYWAQHAGVDLLPYVKQWKDRLELVHIKDMENIETKKCVDAGTGTIDFAAIIAAAARSEYFIYEQEEFDVSPWVSAEASYQNMEPLLEGR